MGNLLKVAQVKQFFDVGYDGLTDVYVGVYEDLAKEEFASRIAGWGGATSRNVKLCYLAIDEFTTLRRRPTEAASLIKFVQFGLTYSKRQYFSAGPLLQE